MIGVMDDLTVHVIEPKRNPEGCAESVDRKVALEIDPSGVGCTYLATKEELYNKSGWRRRASAAFAVAAMWNVPVFLLFQDFLADNAAKADIEAVMSKRSIPVVSAFVDHSTYLPRQIAYELHDKGVNLALVINNLFDKR